MISPVFFRILLFLALGGISALFYSLAEKHKGEKKGTTYNKLGRFFASLPWIILIIGISILLIAGIYIVFFC